MKVTKTTTPEQFKPVTLHITLETQEEVNTLYAVVATHAALSHKALQLHHKAATTVGQIDFVTTAIHRQLTGIQTLD